MLGTNFFFDLDRKYISAFGTLFNDIYIQRTDSTGKVTQLMKVPLTFMAKDAMIAAVEGDPSNTRQTAIQLPRMSFALKDRNMDMNRKKNTLNMIVRKHPTDSNHFKMQFQSVPWNLHFELYIYVKFYEDGSKIVEQILPWFKPQWDMTLNLIPEMNINLDTPVFIDGSVSLDDSRTGKLGTRQTIVYTIPFMMKAEYYGPIKNKPIIKFSETEFYFENNGDMVGYYNIQPGLTANGQPTNDANNSVDPNTIFVTDDFGYVVDSAGQVLVETSNV